MCVYKENRQDVFNRLYIWEYLRTQSKDPDSPVHNSQYITGTSLLPLALSVHLNHCLCLYNQQPLLVVDVVCRAYLCGTNTVHLLHCCRHSRALWHYKNVIMLYFLYLLCLFFKKGRQPHLNNQVWLVSNILWLQLCCSRLEWQPAR